MSNFRQAPKLYHSAKKSNRDFYLLPQNLMDSIFNQLNGKQGNQIKLMSVLLGTVGDGSFGVSEKWICDRTGMNQSNYSRARSALIEKGWLKLENGKLQVDFAAILQDGDPIKSASEHAYDMSSENETCVENMVKACDDSMHNKEKQIKSNIKRINSNYAGFINNPDGDLEGNEGRGIPDHIQDRMRELGIDFGQHSVAVLEEIVGEKLDFYILNDLISRYQSDFVRAKGRPGNYLFGILKQKVKSDYRREQHKREMQCLQEAWEQEQRRLEPGIDRSVAVEKPMASKKTEDWYDLFDVFDDADLY